MLEDEVNKSEFLISALWYIQIVYGYFFNIWNDIIAAVDKETGDVICTWGLWMDEHAMR